MYKGESGACMQPAGRHSIKDVLCSACLHISVCIQCCLDVVIKLQMQIANARLAAVPLLQSEMSRQHGQAAQALSSRPHLADGLKGVEGQWHVPLPLLLLELVTEYQYTDTDEPSYFLLDHKLASLRPECSQAGTSAVVRT